MVAQRKKQEKVQRSFWSHPITILVLSAVVLPGAIGLGYKTIPRITLLLAQIEQDHAVLGNYRSHTMEAEADIDTLEVIVECLVEDVNLIKAQLEEQEETNDILRALYLEQTGREWGE